ncbi:hypothetical protein HN958_04825, partial [Candidatus Falkowbacteria bacterium]|nr:hypothetical protein [Candidatus Falkowbacteria bacterium]
LSEDLVAEKLFEQRKEFGKYEFLSEKTKNVIVMSGFDYRTGYDFEDQVGITSLAKAANVPDENISVIDGKEGETAVENLHTQIANSSGQTVLWLEGHGSLDGKHMAVNKEVKLKVSQIAEALIARLLKTKDPETCKDLTIGFEACFSYDITNNIMTEMERVYRLKAQRELDVPFEEISLPKVITSSYEASWSTHSAAVIGQPIAKYAEYIQAIKQEGKLLGKFFLREIQPRCYVGGDMAFFNNTQKGQILEISSSARPKTREMMAAAQ